MKMKIKRGKQESTTHSSRALNIDQCRVENTTFAGSLNSKCIKTFIKIIKAMNFINNTEIQISNHGFKYVVEESKCFQTSAYIKKGFFSSFITKFKNTNDREVEESESVSIGVNLSSFTDLLAGFVDNDLSNMKISYFHKENRLLFTIIQMDEGEKANKGNQNTVDPDHYDEEPAGELRTEFFLKTMRSGEPFEYDTSNTQTLSNLILNAADFHGILSDFDKSEELQIKITPQRLTLKSIGALQHNSVAKLTSISEIFSTFECSEPSKFIYKFSYFRMVMRALVLASKTSICVYEGGLMRIQLMVRTDDDADSSLAFVEYIMLPSLADEEDDDEM